MDAICLPSDMLQDRIWGLSCNAAQLVEGQVVLQVEQVGSAYLGRFGCRGVPYFSHSLCRNGQLTCRRH